MLNAAGRFVQGASRVDSGEKETVGRGRKSKGEQGLKLLQGDGQPTWQSRLACIGQSCPPASSHVEAITHRLNVLAGVSLQALVG